MTRSTPQSSDWLVPDWPAPAQVRALCTTRAGGVSGPPFDSLNLGTHVGDDAAHVAHNRKLLQDALGAEPVFLNQVHGTAMLELTPDSVDGALADGAFSRERGMACTIMVADCLPVLLCDASGTQVGAVHAGWRGLAGDNGIGILEQAFTKFMPPALAESKQFTIELIAWLGPCIGPEAFEVGSDVVAAFTGTHPRAMECFKPLSGDKWLADLPALARQRLAALGVAQVFGNDGSPAWCTVANPLRFFSHRRDRVSGRQAACIWLE
ncbi:MAG: peptidoglycan editing factor PgeF [Pseudomonadota bacterium]